VVVIDLVAEDIGDSLEGGSLVDYLCRQRMAQRIRSAIPNACALEEIVDAVPDIDLVARCSGTRADSRILFGTAWRRLYPPDLHGLASRPLPESADLPRSHALSP
jgi:hypothetical protein